MITTQKLGAWIAIVVLSVVFAPQAWAAGSSSSKSAVSATSAKAAVSASSSAIPAAVQQALAQPEGKERDKAVKDAALEWQKSDPAAALGWAVAQGDAQPKSQLYRGLVGAVSSAWAKRDAPAAVAWGYAKAKSNPAVYEKLAFHLALCSWGASDPKAAVAWSDTVLADSSKDIVYLLYFSIADGWVAADAAAAVAWAATVKDDKNRQTAVSAIVSCWLKTGKKPDGIAPLVEKLPHDNLKSAAMMIAPAWAKKDASKAKAWVGTLSLSEAEKAEILAKTK